MKHEHDEHMCQECLRIFEAGSESERETAKENVDIEHVKDYLKYRRAHLKLEWQKIPHLSNITPEEVVSRSLSLGSKIKVLQEVIDVLDAGAFEAKAKYHKSKVEHLNRMKIAILEGEV